MLFNNGLPSCDQVPHGANMMFVIGLKHIYTHAAQPKGLTGKKPQEERRIEETVCWCYHPLVLHSVVEQQQKKSHERFFIILLSLLLTKELRAFSYIEKTRIHSSFAHHEALVVEDCIDKFV